MAVSIVINKEGHRANAPLSLMSHCGATIADGYLNDIQVRSINSIFVCITTAIRSHDRFTFSLSHSKHPKIAQVVCNNPSITTFFRVDLRGRFFRHVLFDTCGPLLADVNIHWSWRLCREKRTWTLPSRCMTSVDSLIESALVTLGFP